MTRSSIDRLGKRLALAAEPGPDDLRALTRFQMEHAEALDTAAERLQQALATVPNLRRVQLTQRVKTVNTLIDKVRRSTALSSVQDVVGVRIVANLGLTDQDRAVEAILAIFPGSAVTDRRLTPTHGYRAVHIVAIVDGFRVEVQVRTLIQHAWADAFEKLADNWGRQIRYGGAPTGADASEVESRTKKLARVLAVSARVAAFEGAGDAFTEAAVEHLSRAGAGTPTARDAALVELLKDGSAIAPWALALDDLQLALHDAGADIRDAFTSALTDAFSDMQRMRTPR